MNLREENSQSEKYKLGSKIKKIIAQSIIGIYKFNKTISKNIDKLIQEQILKKTSVVLSYILGPVFWIFTKFSLADYHRKNITNHQWWLHGSLIFILGTTYLMSYDLKNASGISVFNKSLISDASQNTDSSTRNFINIISADALSENSNNYATEDQSPNASLVDNSPLNNDEEYELDPEIESWLQEWTKQREYINPVMDYLSVGNNSPLPLRVRTNIEKYIVKEGDTIASIAENFGLLQLSITSNNSGSSRIIKPGDELLIPPVNGLILTVKKGDSVNSIAKKYNLFNRQLAAANPEFDLDKTLEPGAKLVIPDYGGNSSVFNVKEVVPTRIIPKTTTSVARLTPKDYAGPPTNTKLLWPVPSKRITQYYKYRHQAIDVGLPRGSEVWASESGVVIKAGWNKGGYGYYIIVDHENGLQTLYAHNDRLLVKAGDRVNKGQQIAFSGNTGRSTGPHLHYEVRSGNKKLNPLTYTK